ncbi:MAG: hypothetical protein ABI550_09100, partial [Ignavibacteriaceae bacterium]
GDIFTDIFTSNIFNFIIVSSAVQYFSDLRNLLFRLSHFLAINGEIHIIDSPIYTEDEVSGAKKRTEEYYKSIGEPEMTDFYFHHSWKSLQGFDYEILNKNFFKFFKMSSKVNPFPWIKIIFK